MAGDRPVEPDLRLAEAEAILAKFEIFFHRPAEPGRGGQPGHAHPLALGDEAVVEG
jgi:hypothetical protein